MMRGLGLGLTCAIVISCGGAKRATQSPTTPGASAPESMRNPRETRAQIEALDGKIAADLETLQLARPTAPPTTGPDAMAAGGMARDPSCKAPATQTCTDSCQLADSICDNAGKICSLAKELEPDPWASDKCSSATASCEAARTRCCSCS
ncbi:MAG: hypothetical protein WKG01_06800 [Kofleriaceae bacterium]